MRTASRAILALLLSSCLVSPVLAQIEPYDPLEVIEPHQIPGDFAAAMAEAAEARAMFLAGAHAEALEVLRPLADAGNPVAQNIVGIALTDLNGAYGPYDAAEGFRYLEAAALQNFGPAMHNLADSYEETHDGLAPNLEEAFRWYLAAAELGYENSYYDTAYALIYGYGAEVDYDAGRIWAERSLATEDRILALGLMGDMAYFGYGQDIDLEASLNFFLESAAGGDGWSAYYAAYQYIHGEGTPVDEAAALPLLELAVSQDVADAFAFLAELHADGQIEGTDPSRALALAMRGDELEDAYAAAVLGRFHRLGVQDYVPVDPDAARAAFARAFERGQPGGLWSLGQMSYHGEGEPVDHARAYDYFRQAVEMSPDYGSALYAMAYMEMRGEGTPRDLAAATAHIEAALAVGEETALVAGVILFGSPTYDGPQSDPVRALAHCIASEAAGWLEGQDAGDLSEHFATCERLSTELGPEDQARAAELAAAL